MTAGLLFLSSLLWAQRSPDAEMAGLYSRYAWSAYQQDNWQEFGDLVEKGVEFDEDNPDLLSFQGMIHYRKGEFVSGKERYLRAFRNPGQTDYLSRREILAALSEIQYRLKQYDEQIALYHEAEPLDREDGDFLFYTILAFHGTGRDRDARALAEEGLYRFRDQRFLLLLSAWTGEAEYEAVLDEFLDREGILFPDLMARLILEGREGAPFLSRQYAARLRDFNSWFFFRGVDGLEQELPALSAAALDGRVWAGRVVRALWEELPPGGEALLLQERPLLVDESGDGVADWTLRKEGEGSLWLRDENQDGAPDITIRWDREERPSELIYYGRDWTTRFFYDEYPFMERIEVDGQPRARREYLYLPASFALPLLPAEELSWTAALSLNRETLSLRFHSGEAEFLKAAYSLKDSVTDPSFRLFREYVVIDGEIRRFREDSNFDGRFDRTVLLRDWLPYEGYRDLDLDGQFDLRELYAGGRLKGLEVQGDRSRLEEYYNLWNEKRYQLWDFDRTHFYDAVLVRNPDLSWSETPLDFSFMTGAGKRE